MESKLIIAAAILFSVVSSSAKAAQCRMAFNLITKPGITVPTGMSELQVASVEDKTGATGATIFHFPQGARASFDARGGSVASVETSLLEEGSYSNEIDAIVFAGGSTMGLEASSGVRKAIFETRGDGAGTFDRIPSVPSAVVYDFEGRLHEEHDPLVYPDHQMGVDLFNKVVANPSAEFKVGRFGAGATTMVNKVSNPIWGGQGAEVFKVDGVTIFVAVVLNAVGNIHSKGKQIGAKTEEVRTPDPKRNTTLSIVVTDAPLDRNQLRRLSIAVHTSMAESIRPFHTYTDGDILFAVSTAKEPAKMDDEFEFALNVKASQMMNKAIGKAVRAANAK